MARVIQESWDLNNNDLTAIPSSGRNDGAADTWSWVWKYQVPTGQAHILKPSHHFSLYLYDASPAETGSGDCRIKIVVRDQSEQDEKAIYGPALYIVSKDFDDMTKMATLSLPTDLVIEERFFIVILAYNTTDAIDESSSYFNLETIRVRSSI